eukprot:3284222-Pleurochrysis_carterae.AAC.1
MSRSPPQLWPQRVSRVPRAASASVCAGRVHGQGRACVRAWACARVGVRARACARVRARVGVRAWA